MELNEIKGLGKKTEELLHKLKINGVVDLIEYYPYRFEYIVKSKIDELRQDDPIVIDGIIESIPNVYFFGKKNRMTFKLNIGRHLMNVSIFNRAFLKSKLSIGAEVTIIGKYDKMHNQIQASDIRMQKLEKEAIEPVYHVVSGITSKQLNHYIKLALPFVEIEDFIPEEYKQKYNLIEKKKAIHIIHDPIDKLELIPAIARMKYEELFMFMMKMNYLKQNKQLKKGIAKNFKGEKIDELIQSLPFVLTEDQVKCIEEIKIDLQSTKRMNRLVQGDVGSGKTIVAFIATYMNHLSGYQSVMMAPTEILATQHYENAKKVLEPFGVTVALLTGKIKTKEKKEIYKGIEEGQIHFIIGTHAVFTEDVIYKNVGLIITDEQHRFGVNQRSNLRNKGLAPDVLYMSATPIPRTYALTIYGDMDVTSIKTPPMDRKEIKTYLKNETEMKSVLEAMYQELKSHHQIYVVAPLIEESDKSDLENITSLEEKMNKAFGKLYKIGILHGKMRNEEKEEVMAKFQNNEIQILISTTVIEVGVDVKNATMIVIFDSFRFGLSALHQLRGRVGRSNLQSYCILISNRETERLEILTKTNDGFKISEEDFRLRGAGDIFGEKQSGDMVFKLSDIKKDFKILLKAKEDSEKFLEKIKKNSKENKWLKCIAEYTDLD